MEIQEELAEINRFAKAELKEEQVYVFTVLLCDNEVDRDFERFDMAALETLGQLFVGKSGIFDHQWSAKGQTSRVYRTELVREPAMVTTVGEPYCWLKGWAYLMRTEENQSLIAEIEGGIKKEVSVGCSVSKSICSICGAEKGTCHHIPGQLYGEKLCFIELKEPKDAYEWSFVAVPAQRNAGVLKRFVQRDAGIALMEKQAALGRKYLKHLQHEVVRVAMLADENINGVIFAGVVQRLEESELLELKRVYEAQAARRFPVAPQLRRKNAVQQRRDETVFLV